MKPSEIRNFVFDKSAFGYKVEEVENCLNDIADFVELMQKEYNDAQKEFQELKSRAGHLQEEEDSIKQIIVSAQKLSSTVASEAKAKAKELVDNAQKQSEQILAEATAKSKNILLEAEEKAKQIEKEIIGDSQKIAKEGEIKANVEERRLQKLQSEVSDFKSSLLTIYKQHLDLITQLPEIEEASLEGGVEDNLEVSEISSLENNHLPAQEEAEETHSSEAEKMNQESVKKANTTPFKITITEKKTEEKVADKSEVVPSLKQMQEEEKFHSRFGELKFGTHADQEEK